MYSENLAIEFRACGSKIANSNTLPNLVKRDRVLTYLDGYGFSDSRKFLLRDAFEDGLDIDKVANLDYQYDQMQLLLNFLKHDVDITELVTPSYSVGTMIIIGTLVEHNMLIPPDLSKDIDRSVAKAVVNAIVSGVEWEPFLRNGAFVKNHITVVKALKDGVPLEDLDWITEEMTYRVIKIIFDLKNQGYFTPELLTADESQIIKYADLVQRDLKYSKNYSSNKIKTFKIFKDFRI